jgi:hypothetical protein
MLRGRFQRHQEVVVVCACRVNQCGNSGAFTGQRLHSGTVNAKWAVFRVCGVCKTSRCPSLRRDNQGADAANGRGQPPMRVAGADKSLGMELATQIAPERFGAGSRRFWVPSVTLRWLGSTNRALRPAGA